MAPLDPARERAILDATLELLSEVGYDRMSVDQIAKRARASKATIYRAWPNKPELVMDAITHRFGGELPTPDTGSLRGDLYELMTIACAVANSDDGAVISGLMTAATQHTELSQTMHRCLYETKHPMYETILRRASERGEIPDTTCSGLLHEVMHSLVLARRLGQDGPMDEAFVTRVVDRVLLPVLRQPG